MIDTEAGSLGESPTEGTTEGNSGDPFAAPEATPSETEGDAYAPSEPEGEAPVLDDLGEGYEVASEHEVAAPEQDGKGAEPREPGPESFRERVLAILFTPTWAFSHHRAGWGWARPWLLVSAIGILAGAVTLAKVDMAAIIQDQFERSLDKMPSEQRKRMEAPATKEMLEKGFRFQAFLGKVMQIAGPPLVGLVGILFWGGVIYVLTRFLRGPGTPNDLMRCVSLTAYLSLVDILRYGALALGALLGGGGIPQASPAGWVDPIGHPVLAVALSRLDPVTILWYVLLAMGLMGSLKLPRKRAVAVSVGLFTLLSLLLLGMAWGGSALQGMKFGGGA